MGALGIRKGKGSDPTRFPGKADRPSYTRGKVGRQLARTSATTALYWPRRDQHVYGEGATRRGLPPPGRVGREEGRWDYVSKQMLKLNVRLLLGGSQG